MELTSLISLISPSPILILIKKKKEEKVPNFVIKREKERRPKTRKTPQKKKYSLDIEKKRFTPRREAA